MSRLVSLLSCALVLALSPLYAQGSTSGADHLVGTWAGAYSGDGNGKYTMVLSRDADKKITGTVEVSPDGGNGYSATFKSVVVDGAVVKMAYDDPNNSAMEIQLETKLDGDSMTGTWKSVDTGAKTVVASGTLTGSKH